MQRVMSVVVQSVPVFLHEKASVGPQSFRQGPLWAMQYLWCVKA